METLNDVKRLLLAGGHVAAYQIVARLECERDALAADLDKIRRAGAMLSAAAHSRGGPE